MKILICGEVHAGKSTLIKRLVSDLNESPKGYISIRRDCPDGVSRVYLYNIAEPPENIGDAAVIISMKDGKYEGHPEIIDKLGTEYLKDIPKGSLVVLDEIGTLESRSPNFQKAVFNILGGDYRVLASVKAKDTEFLCAVRSHPDCRLYIITPENRDELYEEIKKSIR